ncbi:MAG: hypothetical protein ABFE02_00385 [Sulfuricella sp.]
MISLSSTLAGAGSLIRPQFITHLVVALVAGLLFGALAWFFQAARLGADLSDSRMEVAQLKGQATADQLAGEIRARKLKEHFDETAERAASLARDRERADAQRLAALRAERDGLRLERDQALASFAQATPEAQLEYVTTLDAVFGECSAEYEAMAGKAAGHASDAQELWDRWPEYKVTEP